MTATASSIARLERFDRVSSTNDVVRDWLAAGEPEVCIAVADEQTAGRGRDGRTWRAPPGAALLLSAGFRPTWLPPDRVWRLAATVSLAMAEAAEETAGLPGGAIGLKWPNDLVNTLDEPARKLAGVLGETAGLGTPDPRVVVGIGVNVDWPADLFPDELAASMTSLRAIGEDVDREVLLERFQQRLDAGVVRLRSGDFDAEGWAGRQVTTGHAIELHDPDGSIRSAVATGVDAATGALMVRDGASPDAERAVLVGEVRHVRFSTAGSSV